MSSGALRGLLTASLADPFFGSIAAATRRDHPSDHRPAGDQAVRRVRACRGFPAVDRIAVPVLLVTATGREAEAAAAAHRRPDR